MLTCYNKKSGQQVVLYTLLQDLLSLKSTILSVYVKLLSFKDERNFLKEPTGTEQNGVRRALARLILPVRRPGKQKRPSRSPMVAFIVGTLPELPHVNYSGWIHRLLRSQDETRHSSPNHETLN
jgi:hypothetical protein